MLGMNKLPVATRVQILSLLVEGSSLRSISRVAGVSINTVTKLLVDAGRTCAEFHDRNVRKVEPKRIQCDEIWNFCYAKKKNVPSAKAAPEGAGDVWTWTAIDAESKLMVSWLMGSRDSNCAYQFLRDLRTRVKGRPQITTDGHKPYIQGMAAAFGDDVDYAQLVKLFGQETGGGSERRYSPAVCIGARTHVISGSPDKDHVNTSFAERQNLTMRMSMRRFTRLTNAFSKKFENQAYMLAIYFVHYNWMRKHKTLGTTPAIAAGLTPVEMTMADVVQLIDSREMQAQLATRQAMLNKVLSN
jgi:IS1 family transposase/lambda repressor-like predicted transcriptional regulator